jgi:hypothetical protein
MYRVLIRRVLQNYKLAVVVKILQCYFFRVHVYVGILTILHNDQNKIRNSRRWRNDSRITANLSIQKDIRLTDD